MDYTRLTVQCRVDFIEILIAEIGEAGFQTFMELENGFEAYVESGLFEPEKLSEIITRYNDRAGIRHSIDRIPRKNWNEEWEKNYEPILVEGQCLIRAHFHKPEKDYPLEIVITPKMSFGTGHHQTTYLMVKGQLQLDHRNKKVMDAGCGTAVLSIVASKLGADAVEAFDIDEWSVVNGEENIRVNHCTNIHLQQGKIRDLTFPGQFDIILANINKNVLLDEIPQYKSYLNPGGKILLSGFYEKDIPDLAERCSHYNLQELNRDKRDNWASLLMVSGE